jgi:hypothetical protein
MSFEIAVTSEPPTRCLSNQAEQRRRESLRQLDPRRRVVVTKLDRGYDDFSKPFDLLVRGNETGDWRGVWDEFRNWTISTA